MTSIRAKVMHVMTQTKLVRDHRCHWPGCTKRVPPARWGCRFHWYELPPDIRTAIWQGYQPGQEVTMTPSRRYLDIAQWAQRWITAWQDGTKHSCGSCSYEEADGSLMNRCVNCRSALNDAFFKRYPAP